jgi:hypothetical protein
MDFEKVSGSGSAGSVAILALANIRVQGGLKNGFEIIQFPLCTNQMTKGFSND